jgi:GNAT superfamily N-acetyltransferase
VAVHADRQGQGLGSELLRFADRKAREAKVPEIRLYTNSLMVRQMALYGRLYAKKRASPSDPARPLVDMAKPTGD